MPALRARLQSYRDRISKAIYPPIEGLQIQSFELDDGVTDAILIPRQREELKPFIASCVYIAGMLTSAAFGLFPYLLPSNADPARGLTIWNAATASHGLTVALAWWIPGMMLVVGYTVFIYRHFAGKVRLEEEGY